MNRFVKTALAIAVAGSAAQAGTGDNEWAALDSEISGLASSLAPPQDGRGWAVLLRAVYTHSSDDIATAGGPDTSGFNFNDVDIAFWGSQGAYTWRLSADIINNEAGKTGAIFELEDAYIRWLCGGYFNAQVGNFKPRVTRSNSVDPGYLLFIDRSAIGSSMDMWDNGVGVDGAWEQLRWYVAIMNGLNGHTRDHFYLLRGEWDFGSGAGDYEGAMGSSDTMNGTIGASFINDDSVPTSGGDSDTTAYLLDFHGNASQFGFGGEIALIGDDYVGWGTDEDFNNIFAPFTSLPLGEDSKPWNAYLSYQVNQEWEFGVRYEDLDNDTVGGATGPDNTLLSVVANWYRDGGKWQAQWTDIDSDESGVPDGSVFEVGFSVGTSR